MPATRFPNRSDRHQYLECILHDDLKLPDFEVPDCPSGYYHALHLSQGWNKSNRDEIGVYSYFVCPFLYAYRSRAHDQNLIVCSTSRQGTMYSAKRNKELQTWLRNPWRSSSCLERIRPDQACWEELEKASSEPLEAESLIAWPSSPEQKEVHAQGSKCHWLDYWGLQWGYRLDKWLIFTIRSSSICRILDANM